MKLEHRAKPLAPFRTYWRRQVRSFVVALAILTINLLIGIAGYMYFGGYGFVDAFVNASMILGGMGPLGDLCCDGIKLFAAFYALYSGMVLPTAVAIALTPYAHRMLHKFHLAD